MCHATDLAKEEAEKKKEATAHKKKATTRPTLELRNEVVIVVEKEKSRGCWFLASLGVREAVVVVQYVYGSLKEGTP